jgi:hypothetical protein
VLAAQADRRPRLAQEALDRLAVGQGLGQEELDGDPLAEHEVMRRDDHAHPALAEHPLDLELPREDLPGRNHGGHCNALPRADRACACPHRKPTCQQLPRARWCDGEIGL